MKITALILLLFSLAPALCADTLRDPPPPAPVTAAQREALLKEFEAEHKLKLEALLREKLEADYRKALDERLAKERELYAGSINNLWLSNVAVWACLGLFILLQAFTARKRLAEIARLRASREAASDR